MILKSLLNAIVISVDHIGVVPWCLIWWFIWFIVHSVYKKIFLLFLKRISIQEKERKDLAWLYWNIAFTSITFPFALQNLKLTYTDIIDKFYYVLENHISTWFSLDPVPSVHIKLSYVILSGYYLNSICEICVERGLYSLEFLMNELLTLAFISTFPLRCVQFGIAVTTVINVVDFFLAVSKLFTCFCDIAQTKYLRFFIYLFLLFHTFFWTFVYFNILPRYFLYESFKKMRYRSDTKQFSMYLLLNGSLLSLYAVALAKSTVTTMVVDFIRSQSSFWAQSEKNETLLNEMNNGKEELEKIRIAKKKENLLKLYHTVKCAIRIKRKLKRIRSKLKGTNFSDTCNETNENYESLQPDELGCAKMSYKQEVEELVDR